MPALKWGLIGASDIAATRVIGAIRASGGDITGVYSNSPERAREFAASHALPGATYGSGRTARLWRLTPSDISSSKRLALRPGIQGTSGRQARPVRRNPWPWTHGQATAMVELAEERGLVLAANHQLPGSPLHAKSANSSTTAPSAPCSRPKSPTPSSCRNGCAAGGWGRARPEAV